MTETLPEFRIVYRARHSDCGSIAPAFLSSQPMDPLQLAARIAARVTEQTKAETNLRVNPRTSIQPTLRVASAETL
jgi:hypothetical protein